MSGGAEVKDFTYEGNKLEQIITTRYQNSDLTGASWQVRATDYVYTDNLITEISTQSFNQQGEGASLIMSYQYDSLDRIIGYPVVIYVDGAVYSDQEWSITYNSDGSITTNSYTENSVNGVLTVCVALELQNNNIVSQIPCSDDNYFLDDEMTATYDMYNNPFKNIIGHSSILYSRESDLGIVAGFYVTPNNPTNIIYTDPDGDINSYNYTYEYNDSGYPISVEASDGDIISFEYIES